MNRCAITGAASGIGLALARELVRGGASVVGIDRDAEAIDRARRDLQAAGARVEFHLTDLADADRLDRLIESLSDGAPFDLFIHNAGLNEVGSFKDSPPDRAAALVGVNFTAPMLLTAALLKRGRIVAPDGALVFLSSLSSFVGYPGAAVYAAAKHGVAAYARSLGAALAPFGVCVTTVFPGPTRTAMAERCAPIDNARAVARRMPPERLAELVLDAVRRRKRVLIPGAANGAMAFAGRLFPSLTDSIMRRAIFEKLRKDLD